MMVSGRQGSHRQLPVLLANLRRALVCPGRQLALLDVLDAVRVRLHSLLLQVPTMRNSPISDDEAKP